MGPMNLEEIREFVHSESGQDEITAFTDHLRTRVGSRDEYTARCQEAEKENSFGAETIRDVLERFDPLIRVCPPGHDRNHILRDILGAIAITGADPYVAKARFQMDVSAGILAAGFHDIGNAVTHRYQDTERRAGHAEIGAWLFFHKSEDFLGRATREIAAYAIAAHTHYLKPVAVKNPQGYERQPYWYELWEIDEQPVGLSILLTRFADRLDTNGVTHFARHLLATADAAESGGGMDLTGDQFFAINAEALTKLLLPEVREGGLKPPTVLEHMANFGRSNFGASVYSRDDHLFPSMMELMRSKVNQIETTVEVVARTEPDMNSFSDPEARVSLKELLRKVSGSPYFERSWKVLEIAWEKLSAREQARWMKGIVYAHKAYLDWLYLLAEYASRRKEYRPLAWDLVRMASM